MSKRIPELDSLRAVAVGAVFLHHALDVPLTWFGVDIFFVLSGFLITGILLDMPKASFRAYIGQFYERRVRRILPPYVLLLIVGSLIFGLSWTKAWYLYFGLMNYLFIVPDAPFLSFNLLWSLAVEEQFYLVWPVIVYAVRPRRLLAVLAGILVAAPLLRGIATPWLAHQYFDRYHQMIYQGTPFRMDCLAMGCLMTFFWRSRETVVRRFGYLGLAGSVIALGSIYALSRTIGGFRTIDGNIRGNVVTYELTLCAATGLFLWALGGRYTGVFRWAPVRFLGKISYSFYLIHECARQLAKEFLHSQMVVAAVGFAASVIYATASWYLMEQPILTAGSRKIRRLEVRAAQPKPRDL